MLTAKQENFVELLTQGTSQTSAYKSAYDTQNMSNKTVWEEASRLRRHPKVSTRILELEKENEDRQRLQAVSREERVLNKLESIAFGDAPYAGKLKAMEQLQRKYPRRVPTTCILKMQAVVVTMMMMNTQ